MGIDSAKMDALCDAVASLGSRVDAVRARRADASTADQERKWQISGVYPNGNKRAFTVLAFNHSDAKAKAEAKKGGATITDIVLIG